jgi:hypothetical protein
MYVLETLKKTFGQITGVGRPSSASMHRFIRRRKAHASMFRDDGAIPNNSTLPFVHYRSPVRLTHAPDPAAVIEELFESNGWGGSWRNGIYDFLRYHSGTHEVLGIAHGHARVRFGGRNGKIVLRRRRRHSPGRHRPPTHLGQPRPAGGGCLYGGRPIR